MKTTEMIIRIRIKHETDKCKHQALSMLSGEPREKFRICGQNGNGERYELIITQVKEISIK